MRAHVLVVDEDISRATALKDMLRMQGYLVHICDKSKKVSQYICKELYDLILFQIEQDTFFLRHTFQFLETHKQEIPVIVTLESSSPQDRVNMLKMGCSDCISTPYHPAELELRIKNALKKRHLHSVSLMQTKHFTFNQENGEVVFPWGTVLLRKKEYAILSLLLQYKNQLVSKKKLIETVWSLEHTPTISTIDVNIRRLRLKLKDYDKKIIKTIHGRGFLVTG